METIRWGIIGCGDVTEVKSGPALQKADGSDLVAVMRRNGALAKDYAARHGVASWYDDAEKLIADPNVDAIYVATPPSSHMIYAVMAADAGKPIYVEKPMGITHAECLAMNQAAADNQVPLFVAYYRRALPQFLKIKALLDDHAIGDIRAVNITLYRSLKIAEQADGELPWRVLPEIAGGGHFVDLASHMLDLLDFFFGPISMVAGFAANQAGLYPAEDVVAGSFRFESGIHGSGSWCFSSDGYMDRTEIVGSKGILSYGTFDNRPVTLTTPSGTQNFHFDNPPHIQQPLIQSVVDTLRQQGDCPSTGESAARTTWVIDEILQQYRQENGERA